MRLGFCLALIAVLAPAVIRTGNPTAILCVGAQDGAKDTNSAAPSGSTIWEEYFDIGQKSVQSIYHDLKNISLGPDLPTKRTQSLDPTVRTKVTIELSRQGR
jgi:hypothetical protein